MSLDELLDDVTHHAASLSESRLDVRASAVSAIRAIEARLVEALAGERLRGLPNLGTRLDPFYAQRVLSKHSTGARLPPDGREVLAIHTDGRLIVVSWRVGRVVNRPLVDDEIVLEDLEPYVRIVGDILERFVALSERRTARIDRAGDLARRLIEVAEEFSLDTA